MPTHPRDIADDLDEAETDCLGVDGAGRPVVMRADANGLHGERAVLAAEAAFIAARVIGNKVQRALTEAGAKLFGLAAAANCSDRPEIARHIDARIEVDGELVHASSPRLIAVAAHAVSQISQ